MGGGSVSIANASAESMRATLHTMATAKHTLIPMYDVAVAARPRYLDWATPVANPPAVPRSHRNGILEYIAERRDIV
jgi:hypothetical protein